MLRTPRTLFILAALAIIFSYAASVIASDSITATQNTPISVTGPDTICKKVTNGSPTGLTEYIPTNSAAEWQSFVAHPPAGVTLATCAPPCAGKLIGGYCWYYGNTASGVNCNTVCSSHNGCNVTGIDYYVGQFGTNANCRAVLTALGAPLDTVNDYPYQSSAGSCMYYGGIPGLSGPQRERLTGANSAGNSCAGPNNGWNVAYACSCNN